MATALRALVAFYRTGETTDREAYDIAWVQDKASPVDTINGFVEVYLDARSIKGAWEALVLLRQPARRRRRSGRSREHAQWFEDRMPWDPKYRKQGVHGVTANAIDVVIETGDSGPITPVGINLPNDQAIRERYGSKSVSLSNVNEAYDKSTLPEFRSEFSLDAGGSRARATKWNAFAGELTTNMHEVIGHGSGKVDERLNGNPQSALEGAVLGDRRIARGSRRAVFPAGSEAGRARPRAGRRSRRDRARRVRGYARNALVQLRRVREGHAHRRRSHAQPPDDRRAG